METVEDEIRHPHVERRGDFLFSAEEGIEREKRWFSA
jgi:hypothetical protein